MIENANPIMRFLWTIQATRKIKSDDLSTKYASIKILSMYGSKKHIDGLVTELFNQSHSVRNSAAQAIREIYRRTLDEDKPLIEHKIKDNLIIAQHLDEKIALINTMREFPIEFREDVITNYLLTSEVDLQYIAIKCIADTENFDILDNILKAADNTDLILRKAALSTWFTGLKGVDFNKALDYCTPRIHYLIRASYELQTEGLFLKEILANVTRSSLPKAKAYPDFIIRYFTELLGKWEYDPDAYHSLHAILVPSYFTFDEPITDDDKPFIIL